MYLFTASRLPRHAIEGDLPQLDGNAPEEVLALCIWGPMHSGGKRRLHLTRLGNERSNFAPPNVM